VTTHGKLVALELVAGIFGWIWILASLAAIVLFVMALGFNGPWSYFIGALGIGCVTKWVAQGFHANKIRVAYEAHLRGQDCSYQQGKEITMPSPAQVGAAGEAAAVAALQKAGWQITVWNTQAPGSTDIEAVSGASKLILQVKSAVVPGTPASISGEEDRNLKSRATKIGADAYEARVSLDQALSPLGVDWRKLT